MPVDQVIELKIDIRRLVRQYEREFGWKLPTWKDRMTAVAFGAIDHDDAEHFINVCASIADQALDAARPDLDREAAEIGGVDVTPTWQYLLDGLYSTLVAGEPQREAGPIITREMLLNPRAVFIQCGEVADRWLTEKAKR
jgi:hypothetical protein